MYRCCVSMRDFCITGLITEAVVGIFVVVVVVDYGDLLAQCGGYFRHYFVFYWLI